MKKALRRGEPYLVYKFTIKFYRFQISVNYFNPMTYSDEKDFIKNPFLK